MRAFFGLGLDPDSQAGIDSWRTKSFPAFQRPVDQYNFHVTLTFLGEISINQIKALIDMAALIQSRPFDVTFDSVGYWPKQGIYYLAPSNVPDEIVQLAEETKQIARRGGLRSEKRRYQPHLTLARRCDLAPPDPLLAPRFNLDISEFYLFESIRKPSGVQYEIVEAFQLKR